MILHVKGKIEQTKIKLTGHIMVYWDAEKSKEGILVQVINNSKLLLYL